jgi:hypothetical protein
LQWRVDDRETLLVLREGENASAATARSIRSTNGRVIPGKAKVSASLQITFSSPVSEACRRIISRNRLKRFVATHDVRLWHKADIPFALSNVRFWG